MLLGEVRLNRASPILTIGIFSNFSSTVFGTEFPMSYNVMPLNWYTFLKLGDKLLASSKLVVQIFCMSHKCTVLYSIIKSTHIDPNVYSTVHICGCATVHCRFAYSFDLVLCVLSMQFPYIYLIIQSSNSRRHPAVAVVYLIVRHSLAKQHFSFLKQCTVPIILRITTRRFYL